MRPGGDRATGDAIGVRGDDEDVFSHGFLCPKATGLKHLHEDRDRLSTPLVKQPDGSFAEAGWDEALRVIDERLSPILDEHGRDAVAVYVGNPSAHNLSALTYGPVWIRALGSQERLHREHRRPDAQARVRRPDVRRAALDPGAGRGPHRPPADPRRQPPRVERQPAHRARHARPPARRSASAAARSWWSTRAAPAPPRPPTSTTSSGRARDAHLLLGIVHTLFDEDLTDPGRLSEHLNGLDEVERAGPRLRPRGGVGGAAGSRPTRSAGWPASWRPPRAPPSTGASAPARRSSARWRAGWWTW